MGRDPCDLLVDAKISKFPAYTPVAEVIGRSFRFNHMILHQSQKKSVSIEQMLTGCWLALNIYLVTHVTDPGIMIVTFTSIL